MKEALKAAILNVLANQSDMTIATIREDQFPQATTVSYASDDLDIYFGCWIRSQKAQNIARNNKISLTVTAPYTDWNSIKGISLGGTAERVTAPGEIAKVEGLFFKKFPSVVQYAPEDRSEMIFFRIAPLVISVLDYTKGFGHSDLVTL